MFYFQGFVQDILLVGVGNFYLTTQIYLANLYRLMCTAIDGPGFRAVDFSQVIGIYKKIITL